MFLVCIYRVYTCHKKRSLENPNNFKNTYEKQTYFYGEDEMEHDSDINKSEL